MSDHKIKRAIKRFHSTCRRFLKHDHKCNHTIVTEDIERFSTAKKIKSVVFSIALDDLTRDDIYTGFAEARSYREEDNKRKDDYYFDDGIMWCECVTDRLEPYDCCPRARTGLFFTNTITRALIDFNCTLYHDESVGLSAFRIVGNCMILEIEIDRIEFDRIVLL